jgi:5-methylcytosine-specific restriction endonuclease McrA
MKVVKNPEELETNISIFESYLRDNLDDNYNTAKSLIKNGNSFIAYRIDDQFLFAPSRYIGYAGNSLIAHQNNDKKNGGATDAAISKVLNKKPAFDEKLDGEYLKFIRKLGLTPKKIVRKFWDFTPSMDFLVEVASRQTFPEGKEKERLHRIRERNNQAVLEAKREFKSKHGRLFCEACGFDFEETYGTIGKDFIEAHHTIPVSEMMEGHETKIDDLIMLCANCHRMAHRKRPWLTKRQLTTELIDKTTQL